MDWILGVEKRSFILRRMPDFIGFYEIITYDNLLYRNLFRLFFSDF